MTGLPLLKNDGLRQLGSWHSQLNGNIKNVPNHQPDDHFRLGCADFFPIRCIRQHGWTLLSLSERVKEHRFWWETYGKMTTGLLFLDVSCWRKNVIMMLGAIGTVDYAGCWVIWVFPEIGAPPVLIHFNRILHDIRWRGTPIDGNHHLWQNNSITMGCSGWSLT